MSYVIERDIPIPPTARRPNNCKRGARSVMGAALESMKTGQSFLIESLDEYNRARSLFCGLKPRRFVSRKVPHEGWRIWRVE